MKIPITDKFLWDLYKLIETSGDVLNTVFPPIPTMKEAIYPDLRKFRREYEKRKLRKNFSQFIYYLKRQGYIKVKNLESKKGFILTKKGINKALKTKFKIGKKKRRKDKKWIMLIFDIPERKRALRNLLRETLSFLGYKMFQKSVWICPFDVLKETQDFIQRNSLDCYVKLFLIEEINPE